MFLNYFCVCILQFKPCGDDETVTDVDGRPMDCGSGPHRKDCPVGSYCHHTAKAARCCRKGEIRQLNQRQNVFNKIAMITFKSR